MDATAFQLALRAAREQCKAGAGTVLDVLLRSAVNPAAVLVAVSRHGGVTTVQDGDVVFTALAPDFQSWTVEQARRARCVALVDGAGQHRLGAADPWDEALMQRVLRASGLQASGSRLPPIAASGPQIDAWLEAGPVPAGHRHASGAFDAHGNSAEPTALAAEKAGKGKRPAGGLSTPGATHAREAAAADLGRRPTDASSPVVDFVNTAVLAAYRAGASDVHFECDGRGVAVKHRLDGVLVEFARLQGARQAEEVISRIKVLAKLDITERRIPQDGRFRQVTQQAGRIANTASPADSSARAGRAVMLSTAPPPEEVDVRVSIMPSVHGEDAVLRLLDKAQLRSAPRSITLDALGFAPHHAKRIEDLALLPSGMLLVTGPTGSGKTTTVYAALAQIQTGQEKIVTIEDPVEYELAGVLQIPVNEKKGLTFARGLRSILRHDPDRILVGEIRDAETAEIAVQSALTGHLVFTTVHANSISDIVGRFRHFGIDMFGFMSALNGVVVQRLMRRICPHCAAPQPATDAQQQWLHSVGVVDVRRLLRAPGCESCHHTGYKGRFVVAEVHDVDDALRDLATQRAPVSALKAHTLARGVTPLLTHAAQQVRDGRTTIEEVRRVIGRPQ